MEKITIIADLKTETLKVDWKTNPLPQAEKDLLRYGMRIDDVAITHHLIDDGGETKLGTIIVCAWIQPLKRPVVVTFDYELSFIKNEESSVELRTPHIKMHAGRFAPINYDGASGGWTIRKLALLEHFWKKTLEGHLREWVQWNVPDGMLQVGVRRR